MARNEVASVLLSVLIVLEDASLRASLDLLSVHEERENNVKKATVIDLKG